MEMIRKLIEFDHVIFAKSPVLICQKDPLFTSKISAMTHAQPTALQHQCV